MAGGYENSEDYAGPAPTRRWVWLVVILAALIISLIAIATCAFAQVDDPAVIACTAVARQQGINDAYVLVTVRIDRQKVQLSYGNGAGARIFVSCPFKLDATNGHWSLDTSGSNLQAGDPIDVSATALRP